jgi:hypothetical protein
MLPRQCGECACPTHLTLAPVNIALAPASWMQQLELCCTTNPSHAGSGCVCQTHLMLALSSLALARALHAAAGAVERRLTFAKRTVAGTMPHSLGLSCTVTVVMWPPASTDRSPSKSLQARCS